MEIDVDAYVKKVASRIQKFRKQKRMSQMDLALEANISQGFLALIESCQKVPTITTIFKIAKALNVYPSSLLEDEKKSREQKKKEIIKLIEKEL